MPHPIVIYSRTVLNGMLLDRAREAGCNVQRSRVMSVDTTTPKPRYCVEGDWQEADFLVLAAGAQNQLVPESRALPPDDLAMTPGYFIPPTTASPPPTLPRHFPLYLRSSPPPPLL